MKLSIFPFLGTLSLSVIGCTAAPGRIPLKEQGEDNYCHMPIETYGDPADPTEREVVDYYGPCDERPGPRPFIVGSASLSLVVYLHNGLRVA